MFLWALISNPHLFSGHTIETTMNIYTHVMKETKVEAIDTLDDIFNI